MRASWSTFGWGVRVSGPERLECPSAFVQSLLLALLGGCKGEPRPAVIGYAFPLWGTTTVQVARDEIASWPATPAIRIMYDSITQGDPPDVEVMRAQRLAQTPNLVAIVGHGGSRGSLAAAPIYAAAGIPQIVPTGTNRLLRQAGPWTFMLAPDDSTEGALIGRFTAERLGARRVMLFFTNDEYGVGLRDGVVAELTARHVAVLDQVGGDPTSDIPTLFEASLRVAFWLPDAPDSMSRAFVQRFQRVTGRDPASDDAMNHDALMLLAHAVRTVGPDRAALRGYLEALGRTQPFYRGITGDITFLRGRTPALVMARLRGGRVVRVAGSPSL